MSRKDYKLPSGEVVGSAKKYIAAWCKLAEPIEAATGLRHVAFDPSVRFAVEGRGYVDLPVWFIELINPAVR